MKAREITYADYGIDAPKVVRNLFVAGLIGFLVWATAALGLWPGSLTIPVKGAKIRLELSYMGLGCAIGFLLTGCYMVWGSKIGKVRDRERLLDLIPWTGKEQVLDLGCGRGLLLIGAAKRLTAGKASGIDIWQAEDLSGNSPEATLENARREGVEERVDVITADMRKIPLADCSADVVLSKWAIHNIYSEGDRAKAIGEIARVLKPGGYAIIEDIRYLSEYSAAFARNGCQDIRLVSSRVTSIFITIITMGSLRPGILLIRKY